MTEIKYDKYDRIPRNYYESEPQIRERRTARCKESPTQQSLPSNNNLGSKLSNLRQRFSQQTPFVKAGALASIILLLYLLSSLILPSTPPSPFFRKFAHETNHVFEQINNLDLPASNSIMQHTVACRNAANMIQHSPAFEKHGTQMATGLREFGEKIISAGRSLQNMYNKGSSIYKAFDIEIEAMTSRLNSDRKKGHAKYFKTKLNKLTTKVQEYRKLVEKAQSSIQNAEEVRHDTEGYIHDGLREAEKFISNRNNAQHIVDITKAKKEFEFVNDVLGHLSNTAFHLDSLRKILTNYEDRLLDVEAELGDVGKEEEDDIFEVTREDLKYLRNSVNNLKSCHEKFQKLSD